MDSIIKLFIFSFLLLAFPALQAMERSILNDNENLIFVDAPQNIYSFVKQNLQNIGLNQPDIIVMVGETKKDDIGWASRPGIIALPFREINSENPDSLINLLQKQNHTPEEIEKINLCRSIIQHEGTHLKNKDNIKKHIVQWTIFGAVTLPLIYCWFNKGASTSNTQALMKKLAFIPASIAALFTNAIANAAYSRYIEQRADNDISDNIDVLQAAANEYRRDAQEDEKLYLNQMEWIRGQGSRKRSEFNKKMDRLFEKLTSTHPSDKQRAEKFEQRIAKLKKQAKI